VLLWQYHLQLLQVLITWFAAVVQVLQSEAPNLHIGKFTADGSSLVREVPPRICIVSATQQTELQFPHSNSNCIAATVTASIRSYSKKNSISGFVAQHH
jgi:hypothetical protein